MLDRLSQTPWLALAAWLALMSLTLFCMMGADKRKAKRGSFRTPERILFLHAVLGGALGGTLGMHFFRHKTKHWYFALLFPLLAVLQCALCAAMALGIIG